MSEPTIRQKSSLYYTGENRSKDSVQTKRRDSSPISQFFDQSRRSFRAIRAKANSLAGTPETEHPFLSFDQTLTTGMTRALADMRLLPSYSSAANKDLSSNSSKFLNTFKNVSYLGCSRIEDPLSEAEMLQIIANFNEEKLHDSVDVCIQIPQNSTGTVRLFDTTSNTGNGSEISCFPVNRIRFCVRGKPGSTESECFALSFTQQFAPCSSSTSSTIQPHFEPHNQCHVFRCKDPEATAQVLFCFANAFYNADTSNKFVPTNFGTSEFEFEIFLELKEEDLKTKTFSVCPVEKNCIKMRRDRQKRVVIVLRQTAGPRQLSVRKCFGVLLAAGRNLRESDMQLLDIENASEAQNKVFVVEAIWNSNEQNFEVLNTETPKDTRVFMTVAVDVILSGIDEPVRFNVECKARVYQQFERFWYVPRKAVIERYFLTNKMDEKDLSKTAETSGKGDDAVSVGDFYKVVRLESQTERDRNNAKLADGRSSTKMPTQLIHPADDDESDSDEPLLSGSGEVNRECSEDILQIWREVIHKWQEEPDKRPDELSAIIVNDGVPDVLRGVVWQLLAKVHKDGDLVETYRMLFDQECPSDQVILRDIHRTFPAHDYFKESNGVGQEALYKLSKAYSLYDEEVGYCQGLSFLGAALLLHMPEEQAFCVLVKIMFDYNLRDLFKLGFDALHLRFYQLQRLIEDYEHELYAHFFAMRVETHMYASQWFLTLFTAKFPLQMVFFIVDLFLTEGINTIFHISLALLQDSKKDLLQLDFEGILKYFRVALPRRYRTEANAKELIRNAVKLKISRNRLSRYEKDYLTMKQHELESLDPLERLERENVRLKETILRLERENDDLAHELVTSKIELRNKLDMTEDQLESTVSAVERKTRACEELEEELRNLRKEADTVKKMCRHEVARLDDELRRSQNVIAQYKKICTDLGNTFDSDRKLFEEQKRGVVARVSECGRCAEVVRDWIANSSQNRRCKNDTTRNKSLITNRENSLLDDSNLETHSMPDHNDGISATMEKHNLNPSGTSSTVHIIDLMDRLEEREEHIRQVELELAQTKLALVESQCQNQDLTHQITSAAASADVDNRPAWIRKTLLSIREVGTSLKSQSGANNTNTIATFSSINSSANTEISGQQRYSSLASADNFSTTEILSENTSNV